jgi:hypothetical protein
MLLTSVANLYANRIKKLTLAWTNLRDFYEKRQLGLIEEAKATYEWGNVDGPKGRVQSQHYIALIKWYQDSLNEMQRRLDSCRSSIISAHSDFERLNTTLAGGGDLMFPTAVPLLNDINDSIWKAESACYPSSSYEDAPPRGHLGSWLVSKESLPLTLILGLMGFGILGATISSLVRRSIGVAKATSDGAYVTDIVGDVSRGLSAAMLVFFGRLWWSRGLWRS